ncbi:MAG: Gfo/Idh/MocA family oxidoreductase [Clostridia bacterium]|nr:Gfo/Idh/MocA family oxidoreductase [Clostridia bacterium]
MSKVFTVSIIGCGSRGHYTYGKCMTVNYKGKFDIVSVCDNNPEMLRWAQEDWNIPDEACFLDENEFFKEKRSDALVIATQDRDHVRMCIKALELGYDILLEKPISPDEDELHALLDAYNKYGRKVIVCHVLRYAPAYVKLKELLDSGEIGKLVCIDWIEQVAYWHQAHSFVRGNWRREDETSPMIMAKCCHDMDLLQYYADAKCDTVYSVGDLAFFKKENQPEGAADRCAECKYKHDCVYSAERLYVEKRKKDFDWVKDKPDVDNNARQQGWPFNVVDSSRPITEESIRNAYSNNGYGRCVFACDNDVVDHQTVLMQFENGVKANLTMTGFTALPGRKVTFHGTLGEVEMDEENDYIRISKYGHGTRFLSVKEILKVALNDTFGHGGGDLMMVGDLYDALCGKGTAGTSLDKSIESHLMALAAEKSRKSGEVCRVHKK